MIRPFHYFLAAWAIIIGGYILIVDGHPPVPINTLIGVVSVLVGAVGIVTGIQNRGQTATGREI